jgi:hypothetical protein
MMASRPSHGKRKALSVACGYRTSSSDVPFPSPPLGWTPPSLLVLEHRRAPADAGRTTTSIGGGGLAPGGGGRGTRAEIPAGDLHRRGRGGGGQRRRPCTWRRRTWYAGGDDGVERLDWGIGVRCGRGSPGPAVKFSVVWYLGPHVSAERYERPRCWTNGTQRRWKMEHLHSF